MQERPASGRRMKTLEDRQGAKRRAAVAVSGVAVERPMEPKGFAPPFASLREKKVCRFSRTVIGTTASPVARKGVLFSVLRSLFSEAR